MERSFLGFLILSLVVALTAISHALAVANLTFSFNAEFLNKSELATGKARGSVPQGDKSYSLAGCVIRRCQLIVVLVVP